jgi:tripartite-type tricarboxylate transporter receptor subunit TctC
MKAVTFTAILSLGAGLFGATSAAHAASIDFSGKTVEVLVGFSPGGGYDAYARALARYLGPNMPGSPQVVVKNMPGAGSMKLALYLVGVAPKDGTSIGTFDPNLITAPLLDPQNAKFDASKFSWVGSIAEGTNVCISWHTSPVKTVDDLISKQAPFGATGRDDARYMDAAIMRNMFGSKLQIITGYQGSSDVRLAMERGEIAGNCGDSWASLKTTAADWIRDKKVHVLAQYALEKHPEIADVPLVMDMAKTDEQKGALKLLFASRYAGRPYAAPPGVATDVLAALGTSFNATMKDPEFVAFAQKANLEVSPATGQQVEDLVNDVYKSPPAAVAAAKAAIQ